MKTRTMPEDNDNSSRSREHIVVTALLALKKGTTERNECLAPATALEQHATALEQHGTRMLKHEHVVTKKLETMEKPAFDQNNALEQTNTRLRKQEQVAKQNETREKPALEQNRSVVQNKPRKRKHQQMAENRNIRMLPMYTPKRFRERFAHLLIERKKALAERLHRELMCDYGT